MIIDKVEYPIVVEVPKVLSREQLQVYVPVVESGVPGIATFDEDAFSISFGIVQLNNDYVKDLIFEDSKWTSNAQDVKSLINDVNALKRFVDYDYSISDAYNVTHLKEFVRGKGENLRILIKNSGLGYDPDPDYPESYHPIKIVVPKEIKELYFVNSRMYAYLVSEDASDYVDEYGDFLGPFEGSIQNTKIIGFEGDGDGLSIWSGICGFNGVEFCTGQISLHYCDNIRHCYIMRADHCNNLFDIICEATNGFNSYIEFDHCTMLNGINATEDFFYEVEFTNCEHISNVHTHKTYGSVTSEGYEEYTVTITYTNCKSVNGETCDGYFTSEDEGKVQVIKLDGTKETISVYDELQIDEKFDEVNDQLGDLSTILTALHEGGFE